MTKEEADTLLYLVDELRRRGARQVSAGGVTAVFEPETPAPGEKPEPRKQKSYQDRLFRHLPKSQQPRVRR